MNSKFAITDIKRVILVGKDEYKEIVTSFTSKTCSNELIFHLSGESTVFFNGKQLNVTKDSIRFLPQGEVHEYIVERKERGECIDIFFDTDVAIANEAFVLRLNLKPAIEYIERNFLDKKITAEELTSCCSISYPYIKKLFIKKFGVPPSKYSIQLKINYACDLLKSELYTISQIAEICGYNDIYFFSRQFKEYMDLSPTDFINKYKSSK